MQQQLLRWHRFETAVPLQSAARDAILQAAQAAIAERGRFLIVLAGGSTPRSVYQSLRDARTDWSSWHVYYGDERCLPPQDAERNSRMASDALLAHVPIPASHVHAMPAELGAEQGAAAYAQALAGVGTFDLVLLGLGEDAHTASLFPGHAWESVPPQPAIAVHDAPKPPADRVSLSASRLSDARQVLFLVTGAGKQDAVRQWQAGMALPVTEIRPGAGVDVFCDGAAMLSGQ